jgi:succinate dehydrogenase/fumarate reductase-like Fe-S protein
MSGTARLHIFRYNPTDGVPSYRDYDVPCAPSLTVIRALFHLAAHADDPPAFRRYMCNRGQCAGCVMTINGRTRRACTTQVRDGMIIEPLRDYPVIRDLVVDFGRKVPDGEGGWRLVQEGALVLRSAPPVRRPHSGRWLFMEVDQKHCLSCEDKPCVRACWVNRLETLEDREGRLVPRHAAPIRLEQGKAVLCGVCGLCQTMPCMDKCPAQAFSLVAGGVGSSIDPQRCIGCGLCVAACAQGHIWLDLGRGHAVKCDLCGGDPRCAQACPCGAITYEVVRRN